MTKGKSIDFIIREKAKIKNEIKKKVSIFNEWKFIDKSIKMVKSANIWNET